MWGSQHRNAFEGACITVIPEQTDAGQPIGGESAKESVRGAIGERRFCVTPRGRHICPTSKLAMHLPRSFTDVFLCGTCRRIEGLMGTDWRSGRPGRME